MSHKIIKTDRAPAAIGPYSQGVVGCGLLFTAMQIALDPASGEMTGSTASEQVNRCLKNVAAIAKAAGCSLDHAVKVTVYPDNSRIVELYLQEQLQKGQYAIAAMLDYGHRQPIEITQMLLEVK